MTTTYSGFLEQQQSERRLDLSGRRQPADLRRDGADSPDGSGRADPFRTLRVGLLVERSASAQYRRNLRRPECDWNNRRW